MAPGEAVLAMDETEAPKAFSSVSLKGSSPDSVCQASSKDQITTVTLLSKPFVPQGHIELRE